MELAPGTVLLGKYRVDEVLGIGGMGRVVRASHLYLQQPVAIKILLPQMTESTSTVQRFLREAQATVNLKSEHIARVIDVGTMPDGAPFMVMEYLDGNDLNQILRHHGPQRPAIVVDLMLQACEGLAEAHAMGVVHRDIKPSNFFITKRADGTMLLKILDFGISKTPVLDHELTGTQTILGTPTYMPPEQMKSGKGAEPRSDIWSLGVVMYQLLTGRPPFAGETYADLVLKVNSDPPAPMLVPLPAGFGDVILRCLEKNPGMRPQNVGELARSLAPYASDPISAAQSATRTTRILQHRTQQKGLQGLPVAAAGGLATPVPISPAQLTPRSWPPTPTSISQGAGQVTHRVRGSRGFLVAGITSLCILAASGGFIASQLLGDGDARPAASAPAALPAPAATADIAPPPTTAPAATAAAPPEVKPPKVIEIKGDAPTEATTEATTEPTIKPPEPTIKPPEPTTKPPEPTIKPKAEAKVATTATTATKRSRPASKPVAKTTAPTKPKPRPAKRRPRANDDLFDTRK